MPVQIMRENLEVAIETIKLAGGIFHTHHHLADGRLEVLVALGLDAGLSVAQLLQLRGAASVELCAGVGCGLQPGR